MKTVGRKWPNISILRIKEKLSPANWNSFLNRCYRLQDIESLKKALYGIQADMSDLAKQGINSNDITTLFLRMQRSLTETARMILKKKHPSPLDNAGNNLDTKKRLAIKQGGNLSEIEKAKRDFEKNKQAKRMRDAEFEQFIKDSSF